MRLAGLSSRDNVKGSFDQSDGSRILIDFTQGPFGRAFCQDKSYDLPDPRAQLVTVSLPNGRLEITSTHGRAASLGEVSVQSLRVNGDISLPVLRAEHMVLVHSLVQANEITGRKSVDDPAVEPDRIKEIQLKDSVISCKSDLSFLNIEADEQTHSMVQAPYMEGFTTQGKLSLQADRLAIGILDAQDVQVTSPDGCLVGRNHCDRIRQRLSLTESRRVLAKEDPELGLAIQSLLLVADVPGGAPPEIDAQGFDID